jgi:hypothetical protein
MGGRHVPDVVEIEGEQRSQLAALELIPEASEALRPEPLEVDPLLPVNCG